jgi:hypothetical protein
MRYHSFWRNGVASDQVPLYVRVIAGAKVHLEKHTTNGLNAPTAELPFPEQFDNSRLES